MSQHNSIKLLFVSYGIENANTFCIDDYLEFLSALRKDSFKFEYFFGDSFLLFFNFENNNCILVCDDHFALNSKKENSIVDFKKLCEKLYDSQVLRFLKPLDHSQIMRDEQFKHISEYIIFNMEKI